MIEENPVQQKSFDFALQVVQLYRLLKEQREFALADQLLRCGTSIGANVEEALAGQTKKDFAAKMSIASKEARETRYWLRILESSRLVESDFSPYLEKVDELIRLLTSIVKTAQKGER